MHRAVRSASLLALLILVTLSPAAFAAAAPAMTAVSAFVPQLAPASAPAGAAVSLPAMQLSPSADWLPAQNLPACFNTICQACFRQGKACTIAGQTCSCSR